MIAVISYGVGNSVAVARMYESLGLPCRLVTNPDDAEDCSHLVLPGVGHFGHAVKMLQESGWDEAVLHFAKVLGRPILGLCLGAQLLGGYSEEGLCRGLDLIPFDTVSMKSDFPIPNMGWRDVKFSDDFVNLNSSFKYAKYYFSHSFEMKLTDSKYLLGTFSYDIQRVAAARHGNIIALQFHPEKSHRYGKDILSWFASL